MRYLEIFLKFVLGVAGLCIGLAAIDNIYYKQGLSRDFCEWRTGQKQELIDEWYDKQKEIEDIEEKLGKPKIRAKFDSLGNGL